jgi:hypothetical protein
MLLLPLACAATFQLLVEFKQRQTMGMDQK